MYKKMLTGVSIAFILFAGTAHANEVENKSSKSSTIIKKINIDVTGDKKADIVTLEGKNGKNGYYENLYVKIENKVQKKSFNINLYEDGKQPNLQLKDFNQDKVQDIHVTFANESYQKDNVYTVKNNKTIRLNMSIKIKSTTKYAANYSFQLPERWKNNFEIHALEGKKAAKEDPSAQFITTLYLKNGKTTNGPLLTIISYKQEDWNKMKKEGGPLPEVIGQAEKFVYVVQSPQSNPFEPTSNNGKLFEKLNMSFEEVQRAFTTNK